MQKFVLIAAGGTGKRTGSPLPKQFWPVMGKPILIYVFESFLKYSRDIHFVLALPEKHHDTWEKLCIEHGVALKHKVVAGGPTRFHSVKNGLKSIPGGALVAIHDGVRPVVSLGLISSVFNYAQKFGNAIPVIPVNESVRQIEHGLSQSLPRDQIRLVQTPQCFRTEIIKPAYNINYRDSFTDDATVLEHGGGRLFLVDGDPNNIKVTTTTDLVLAETLLKTHQQRSYPE